MHTVISHTHTIYREPASVKSSLFCHLLKYTLKRLYCNGSGRLYMKCRIWFCRLHTCPTLISIVLPVLDTTTIHLGSGRGYIEVTRQLTSTQTLRENESECSEI